MWKNKSELEEYIKTDGRVNQINKNDSRLNEQLTYRAIAFFYKMKDLHNIVLETTKKLLSEISKLNEKN